MFPSWITWRDASFWGRAAMKDYVANPQIKYLAEIIDVLLSGADLREKDWTFDKRSAIAHSRFFLIW